VCKRIFYRSPVLENCRFLQTLIQPDFQQEVHKPAAANGFQRIPGRGYFFKPPMVLPLTTAGLYVKEDKQDKNILPE
jgi:hypothetical protein